MLWSSCGCCGNCKIKFLPFAYKNSLSAPKFSAVKESCKLFPIFIPTWITVFGLCRWHSICVQIFVCHRQTGLCLPEVNHTCRNSLVVFFSSLLNSLEGFQFAPCTKSIKAACGHLVGRIVEGTEIKISRKYVVVLLGFFCKKSAKLISF